LRRVHFHAERVEQLALPNTYRHDIHMASPKVVDGTAHQVIDDTRIE
jgi:hypothetical protein